MSEADLYAFRVSDESLTEVEFINEPNELRALQTLRRLLAGLATRMAQADGADMTCEEFMERSRAQLRTESNAHVRWALMYRMGQRAVIEAALQATQSKLVEAAIRAQTAWREIAPRVTPSDTPAGLYDDDDGDTLLCRGSDAGHTLCVRSAVAANTVLASAPLEAVLSQHAAAADRAFAPVLEAVQGVEEDVLLTLYLLRVSATPSSPWAARVAQMEGELAAAEPALLWSADQRAAMGPTLCGMMEPFVEAERDAQEDLHAQLFPALTESFPAVFPAHLVTLDRFLRMRALVRRFGVRAETMGDAPGPLVLVPPACLPSHHAASPCALVLAETEDGVFVEFESGDTPLEEGEAVSLNRRPEEWLLGEEGGVLDSATLGALVWGTVPLEPDPFVVVPLEALVRAARRVNERFGKKHVQLLAKLGLNEAHVLSARLSSTLWTALRVCAVAGDEAAALLAAQACPSATPETDAIARRTLDALVDALRSEWEEALRKLAPTGATVAASLLRDRLAAVALIRVAARQSLQGSRGI